MDSNSRLGSLALAAAMGVAALLSGCDQAQPKAPPVLAIRRFHSDAMWGPVLQELSLHFPDTYSRMALDVTGSDADEAKLDEDLRLFAKDQRASAVNAWDETVLAHMAAVEKVLLALKGADVARCAAYVKTGGWGDGWKPDAAVRQAEGQVALTLVQAIREGTDHPITRAPPSASDYQLLAKALKASNAGPESLRYLRAVFHISGSLDSPAITDQGRCDGAITMLRAIGSMPKAAAVRMLSPLLTVL